MFQEKVESIKLKGKLSVVRTLRMENEPGGRFVEAIVKRRS